MPNTPNSAAEPLTDFVVRAYKHLSDAEEIRDAINLGGLYEAEVRDDGVYAGGEQFAVFLPGPCVEGTADYMRGFLSGFYAAQAIPSIRRA